MLESVLIINDEWALWKYTTFPRFHKTNMIYMSKTWDSLIYIRITVNGIKDLGCKIIIIICLY
jgi:hypothetical protein